MAEPAEQLESPPEDGVDADAKDAGRISRLLMRVKGFLRSQSKIRLGIAGLLLILSLGAFSWLMTGDDQSIPAENIRLALDFLDNEKDINSREEARKLARELDAIDYQDPDFPGAVQFILGIIAFRDAESQDESVQEQHYIAAASFLREAERRALDSSRRPEWVFAFGTSLHKIGAATEARPLLEEAVKTYKSRRTDAAILLTDIYLDLKTPEILQKALELNASIIASKNLEQLKRDRAYLQRAQVLLLLKRNEEAEEALAQVSNETSENQGTIVFRAQTLMAERRFRKAIELLEPVATSGGLVQTYSRPALYLLGVCSERLDVIDAAINYYERTSQKYAKSHEGLAASLRAGDLLRQAGRDEEALDAYRRALKMVRSPEDFRNRWLSLDKFRRDIEVAWNSWVEGNSYNEAISLAKLMPPLFPEIQSRRLAARANELWAENLEGKLEAAPFRRRAELEKQLHEQWRLSGKAYAALSVSLRTSADYPEALWTSAEHFRRGHDFQSALNQLTRFINTRPKQLLATAYVRRGEILMDLDRLDEALKHFQRVIENYPIDPAAFKAQYIIGQCYLERNELKQAEFVWREILLSDSLTPAAKEWQQALLSLGKILFHTATMQKVAAENSENSSKDEEAKQLLATAYSRWEESIRRLDEYLKRYPDADDAMEARYLLAKALQNSASLPRGKLKTAETDNARLELRRTIQQLLDQAIIEFRKLQVNLDTKTVDDSLDTLGQQVLRDCYFEIAHTHYALEHFKEAIVTYQIAANRYPEDPHVLLAYVQMSNCYDHLKEPVEARSMLEQAKIIFKQMPPSVFESRITNMSREEWEQWLDWARRLHETTGGIKTASPG